jgi:uncharacterized membrane protein
MSVRILFSVLIALIAFGLYLMVRNYCVYRYRTRLIDARDWETYDRLPKYEQMLFVRFWVWPLRRFLDER